MDGLQDERSDAEEQERFRGGIVSDNASEYSGVSLCRNVTILSFLSLSVPLSVYHAGICTEEIRIGTTCVGVAAIQNRLIDAHIVNVVRCVKEVNSFIHSFIIFYYKLTNATQTLRRLKYNTTLTNNLISSRFIQHASDKVSFVQAGSFINQRLVVPSGYE